MVLAGTFFAIPSASSAGKSSAQLRKEKAALEFQAEILEWFEVHGKRPLLIDIYNLYKKEIKLKNTPAVILNFIVIISFFIIFLSRVQNSVLLI